MVGIGNERLGVKYVAAHELAGSHGQVYQEANACDSNAGVAFILREKVRVVMMVMVVMMAVAMAGMAPGLRRHQRDGGLDRMDAMTISGRR